MLKEPQFSNDFNVVFLSYVIEEKASTVSKAVQTRFYGKINACVLCSHKAIQKDRDWDTVSNLDELQRRVRMKSK